MNSFMVTLLTCSVAMSVLAFMYLACTPFLIKRYSEKGLYYSWFIVVIGLIIPFRLRWNISPVFQMQIGSETLSFAQEVETVMFYTAAPGIPWLRIVAAVWLAGVIMFLSYHALKHYRFVKMTKRWSICTTDEQTLDLMQALKKEMGITKRIELYVCSSVGSPMLIGLVKPRIFIPTVEIAHDELRYILKHELVHYKRKDLLYKYIVLAATAIHWFNPIIYVVAKEIANLCEISCDAEVVKNMDADTRQFYSEAIIGVVKYKSKLKTALSTSYYGGKNGIKKRISSIMDMNSKRAGIAIVCVTMFITLGTGLIFAANVIPATILENDGTLVPLRTIYEELGAEVEVDSLTQTVTAVRGDTTITMQVGSNILSRNGEQITLDVPPQIVSGVVVVPIRDIAESFGIEID